MSCKREHFLACPNRHIRYISSALQPTILVLPNAWDAASAVCAARAGAPAIATTSAGVAWAHGVPDGGGLRREQALRALADIARVTDLPVTADIEYG